MNDEELEKYIKTIEPNFESHIEKGTIEMSNEYYNLLEERMARLINKNQELQQELTDYKEELAKADSMLQSEIFYGKELSSRELLNMLKDYKEVTEEIREYMLDIDFKMGWQYANYLDELLEKKKLLDKKDKE